MQEDINIDFQADSINLLDETQDYNCHVSLVRCRDEIPEARNNHCSYVRDRKLYVYGGTTDKGEEFSMYCLDLDKKCSWKEVKITSKVQHLGLSGCAIVPEPLSSTYKNFILFYGGWTGKQYSNELCLLNTATMEFKNLVREESKVVEQTRPATRLPISVGNSKEIEKYQQQKHPPARKGHTMLYIPSENKVCLFGGSDGQCRSGGKEELWILSSNWKWERYPGFTRAGHTSVVVDDTERGHGFVVFGGIKGVKCMPNDSLFFNIQNKKWNTIKDKRQPPKGRAYHTANLIGNKIVYVGGMDQFNDILDEVWIFCVDTHVWSKVNITEHREMVRRAGHTSFVMDKRIYLVGGMTKNQGRYERCPMDTLTILDFGDSLQDHKPTMKKPVLEQQMMTRGMSNIVIGPSAIHNTSHYWDVRSFGFLQSNKLEEMQEFYKDIMDKIPGISENEME